MDWTNSTQTLFSLWNLLWPGMRKDVKAITCLAKNANGQARLRVPNPFSNHYVPYPTLLLKLTLASL